MNMKKLSALALTVVIALSAFSPVQAAKKNAWATEYLKVLDKMDEKDKKDKNITYDLIYVDGDKVPELVVSRDYYWVSVYTIYKGKASAILKEAVYGAMGNAGYEYAEKKNAILNNNSDYAGMEYYHFYGKISKGKLVNRNPKSLCEKYYKDKNKNGMPDPDEGVSSPIYYYGSQKVTKAVFEKHTVKGSYRLIKGKISYADMVKKLKKAGSSNSVSAPLKKQWKGTYKYKDEVLKITKVTDKGISGTRKQSYEDGSGYYTKAFSISFTDSKKKVASEEWYPNSGTYIKYKLGKNKITVVPPRGRGAEKVFSKK